MKKTRKLFILNGNSQAVSQVMEDLKFKGTVVLKPPVSIHSAYGVFNNNKSIICSSKYASFVEFYTCPINIEVVNDTKPETLEYIDIAKGNVVEQFQKIADKKNCDIGDHVSNSSGLNCVPKISDCDYCNLFKNNVYYEKIVVYESKNFIVKPTVGEFLKGYVLIIPKNHITSMAELSNECNNEFIDVLQDVEYMLYLTYSVTNFLVWENGTGNNGKGKAKDSIVHAHTHVCPSNLTFKRINEMSNLSFNQINFNQLKEYNDGSYLLIRDDNTRDWWINNNSSVYIPRQYVRQLIAEDYFGINIAEDIWNWRTHPFEELMFETRDDILRMVKQNWDMLPSRIKRRTEKYVD